MPIITSIKPQKNKRSLAGFAGKNRLNIYLDDKFGFGIDLDNFVLLHLKVDQELTDQEVNEIVKKSEFQKTFDKLLMWATLRPRSEREVKDYFRRKKIHDSVQPDLLEKLKHFNLLNDLEFAHWWIDQRIKTKSLKVIKLELRIKGVEKNTIEDALEKVEIDEEKIAKKLTEKKMYKWKNLDERIRKQKISQYLSGKGFDWNVIEKIVKSDYGL